MNRMEATEAALAVTVRAAEEIERILIGGDLGKLNAEQRVMYYKSVCERVGLDPITKPFEFLQLSGKLVLYANKNATEQLRRVYSVSVYKVERDKTEDTYAVTAYGRDATGREDAALGVVSIGGLKGDALANAMMKAETKAKRRLTLSMCGLGMLDETEVETIPGAVKIALPEPSQAKSEAVLIPPSNEATVAGFLDDLKAKAAKATDFIQLAEWFRQNAGIAKKLDVVEEFLDLKSIHWHRLCDQNEGYEPLVALPPTAGDFKLEFYALDAAAGKGSDLKPLWEMLRPGLKDAGLDKEWKDYGTALKKELQALKQEA